ncbi:MAG: Sua5/YciO/YrdC/YwlC family protein, partial [Planctomycetota bacterium]
MTERVQITARGLVQGVGFRPFVYSLATRLSLSGFVQNDTNGVLIDVEGRGADIREFLDGLTILSPPHAVIEDICCLSLPYLGYEGFSIKESAIKDSKKPIISADLSICRDCFKELFHPNNRRYRYPFINCTNCGPRFTIIKDIPYDRIHTTMSGFTMCADCSDEYHNPANRRFHAQPNACHVCGPTVTLSKGEGKGIRADDPISAVCALLNEGKIVAIKGIGGYHLACDAANDRAVSLLRERKHRYDKPFAIMVNGIERVRQFCRVSEIEEASLCSTQRPIVLLKKKSVCAISPKVAPASACLGVMLPYTPLHHLILAESVLALVMTSGN